MRSLNMSRPLTKVVAEPSRGAVTCQVCRCDRSVEEAIVLWRQDVVVFAVCHRCTRDNDIVMRPSGSGVQVLAKKEAQRLDRANASRRARPATYAAEPVGELEITLAAS